MNFPNSSYLCDPEAVITTTGVPDGGFIKYTFFYAVNNNPVNLPEQQMSGNLNLKYPYDQVPEGITKFGIFVLAFDASGTKIGSAIGGKWECNPPEGCTPGYWRQPHHLDDWVATGFSPEDDFDATFGTGFFDPDITLLEATWLRGGGVNVVARHGTAGLLSAAHPVVLYPYTVAEVIAFVRAGNAGPLVEANELGCDL